MQGQVLPSRHFCIVIATRTFVTVFSFPLSLVSLRSMPRKRRWSDEEIEDPDPGVLVQSSLLALWNVVMSPETLEGAWRCKSGSLVKDALALSDDLRAARSRHFSRK